MRPASHKRSENFQVGASVLVHGLRIMYGSLKVACIRFYANGTQFNYIL